MDKGWMVSERELGEDGAAVRIVLDDGTEWVPHDTAYERKLAELRRTPVRDVMTASERYRLLVERLGELQGNRYGWKAYVAGQLGVHPSYISKIVSGQVTVVGEDIIRRAIDLSERWGRPLAWTEAAFYSPEDDTFARWFSAAGRKSAEPILAVQDGHLAEHEESDG